MIYPAIDLKEGKCVRLKQGRYDLVTIYAENPIAVAKEWERQGAKYLHLVDLDGARQGKRINDKVIKQIVEALKIPVQLGGGIRTLEDIQNVLELGIARVILGSAAINQPNLIEEALKRWGADRIIVGVDAKEGKVAIEGWHIITEELAVSFGKKLKEQGIETIIYTDISKDGMMSGPNILELQQMMKETRLRIIASGGITTIQDLKRLSQIGIYEAIIGKALYEEKIRLKEVPLGF